MNFIHIEALKVPAIIGIHDWERILKQPLLIDIELRTDFTLAAASDDIEAAINYAEVCEFVTAWVEGQSVKLLETLISRLSQTLVDKYSLTGLRISIKKTGVVPQAKTVGVSLECGNMRDPE